MTMPRVYERDETKRQAVLAAQNPRPDCLLWHLSLSPNGYGQKMVKGKLWRAHRWVWTQANGPIPDGLQVNHRCDTPACVNLDHLYLGTQKDNIRDLDARTGRTNQKERCPAGHLYAETQVFRPNGLRYCGECHKKQNRVTTCGTSAEAPDPGYIDLRSATMTAWLNRIAKT